jgi:alanine racemase
MTVSAGRWLSTEDQLQKQRVAVIGAEAAQKLFGEIPPQGEEVAINGLHFTVAGVLKTKTQISNYNTPDNDCLFIPYETAALLRDTRTWYDWVRPGLLLYGIVPPPLAATGLGLCPALSLTSRIVAVKGVRTGEGVGYGLRWTAETPRTIAIVPAGYADGLDLRLARRGAVLIRGRRAPIVGSVCMDMLMADVSGLDVSPGDEVVIIGSQDTDRIDVREMAAQIGTIPYEILCRIGSRIERLYE